MDDKSIFQDKEIKPTQKALDEGLGQQATHWNIIVEYVRFKYPAAKEEWNYPGIKYGWSFRIKDPKRVIVYLLPRDKYFKIAFVFGEKATFKILESHVSQEIRDALKSARVYAEGRGIRIDVKNGRIINDLKFLIDTKLAN
jgi:hypothetical protein